MKCISEAFLVANDVVSVLKIISTIVSDKFSTKYKRVLRIFKNIPMMQKQNDNKASNQISNRICFEGENVANIALHLIIFERQEKL